MVDEPCEFASAVSHIDFARREVILNYVEANGRDDFVETIVRKFYKQDAIFEHQINCAVRKYNLNQELKRRVKE